MDDISDDIWVEEPRQSENIFAKKRYTSIVARALINPISTKKYVMMILGN